MKIYRWSLLVISLAVIVGGALGATGAQCGGGGAAAPISSGPEGIDVLIRKVATPAGFPDLPGYYRDPRTGLCFASWGMGNDTAKAFVSCGVVEGAVNRLQQKAEP